MTKLSRRVPLALAVALVSLALHASGCTALLGDLPAGESTDGSVADSSSSGGDTGNPDTSSGPDVTTDTATDASTDEGGGGGMDARAEGGEAGPSCGPSNCTTGCCNTSGQCVTFSGQSAGTCGTGGVACSACASGESCSNGTCTCGGSMCNGCCGSGNTCVSPASNSQCGANGVACMACAADQECNPQGKCVCDAKTCPSGCCDSNQHCVTSTSTSQCGTGGASCQSCAQGQECAAGVCTCDATSCPTGCCNGGPSGTCESYTAQSNNSCGTAGAACGACSMGQSCANGTCTCGGGACAGCCSSGTCTTPSSSACGVNGTACMACSSDQTCSASGQCICDPTTCAGCCDPSTQHCITPTNNNQCGSGGSQCKPCGSGLECSNGVCTCDATSCSMGCCSGGPNGTCELFGQQSGGSCGKSGATCSMCPSGQTCDGSGNCVCNSASCPQGCCSGGPTGTCELYAQQSGTSCGSNGAACAGCANGLCDTTNGTCACDPNTCPSGCCANGACVPLGSESLSQCGTNGVNCGACSGADSCTNGSCECGGNPACASPKSCCVSGSVGSCIDLSSDPSNCGACGHSCQGGTCANGLCVPILVCTSSHNLGFGIAINTSDVFITSNMSGTGSWVESCPIGANNVIATTIHSVTGNPYLSRILYDSQSNFLYFGDNNQSTTYAINTNGVVQWTVPTGAFGLDTDSSTLYLGTGAGIQSVNKFSGGGITTINNAFPYQRGIAYDPVLTKVWAATPNSNLVQQCPTTPGGCVTWTEGSDGPFDIHVAGSYVFFLGDSAGGLFRCANNNDCSPGTAMQFSSWIGTGFAVDSNSVYFADTNYNFYSCPVTGCPGGAPVMIAAQGVGVGGAQTMAVDSTYLYWITNQGKVFKVAK